MTTRIESKPDKLKELILYIAKKSEGDPYFGRTKLNKILFYSDFICYGKHGRSITNHNYVRLPNGPAPDNFRDILTEMHQAGDLVEQERSVFGYIQKRPLALRDPSLGSFSGAEIAEVDLVIDQLKNLNATDVSELSHNFIGWMIIEQGKEIPYYLAFLSGRELTQGEYDYGRRVELVGR